jgi:hypothetical protein
MAHTRECNRSDKIQIAISFATADLEFARQIGEMLEQISYIDDCDTLGQRINKTDIHKVIHMTISDVLLIPFRRSFVCIRKS